MNGHMPRTTLNGLSHINNAAHIGVRLIGLFQFGIFEKGARKGHWKPLASHGNQLGDFVYVVVRKSKRAANIAHTSARKHGTEGANLRHFFLAVTTAHIIEHVVTTIIRKVRINIRR